MWLCLQYHTIMTIIFTFYRKLGNLNELFYHFLEEFLFWRFLFSLHRGLLMLFLFAVFYIWLWVTSHNFFVLLSLYVSPFWTTWDFQSLGMYSHSDDFSQFDFLIVTEHSKIRPDRAASYLLIFHVFSIGANSYSNIATILSSHF